MNSVKTTCRYHKQGGGGWMSLHRPIAMDIIVSPDIESKKIFCSFLRSDHFTKHNKTLECSRRIKLLSWSILWSMVPYSVQNQSIVAGTRNNVAHSCKKERVKPEVCFRIHIYCCEKSHLLKCSKRMGAETRNFRS